MIHEELWPYQNQMITNVEKPKLKIFKEFNKKAVDEAKDEVKKSTTPISGERLLCTNIAAIIIDVLEKYGATTLDEVKQKWSIILPQEFRNAIIADSMAQIGNIIRKKYVVEYIPTSETETDSQKTSLKIHTKKIRDSISESKRETQTEYENYSPFISFVIDSPLSEENNK